jgi:hypothetical protein
MLEGRGTYNEERNKPIKMYGELMYSSTILNLGTRRRLVVSLMPWLLYPRYQLSVSTRYEAGWAPQPVQMLRRREEFSCSCWQLNLDFLLAQPMA